MPLSAIGSPSSGQGLFSVTGFTATQITPSLQTATTLPNGGTFGDENIGNTMDLTPPFSFTIPTTKTKRGTAPALVLLGVLGAVGFLSRRAKVRRLT